MTRIKRGVAKTKRKKNILKRAKGFQNRASTNLAAAREALLRAGAYAYRDRRDRKRQFRRLWLSRLGAALRDNGTNWSKFVPFLKKNNIELNRKMLSEIAIKMPQAFDKMVKDLVAK
ncbi:MAG: 50S ribosomal protein L20 [Candidatus Doudnabacteria bacterium]